MFFFEVIGTVDVYVIGINKFNNIEYNIGLNENIFTERFLRRPPREVTR